MWACWFLVNFLWVEALTIVWVGLWRGVKVFAGFAYFDSRFLRGMIRLVSIVEFWFWVWIMHWFLGL